MTKLILKFRKFWAAEAKWLITPNLTSPAEPISFSKYRKQLGDNSKWLVLALAFFIASCSKSSKAPDTSTTTTTTTTTTGPADPPQFGTAFAGVPATKDIFMYELNLRSFSSTYNLQGVLPRLDSLKALGVNVIWLMPTYPIGVLKAIGSPYCVKDYTSVNTDFGTLADLQTVVSTAHAKGMAVIMDWVADHTSWDATWITNTSWYKQDSNGNIISPSGFNDVAALNYNTSAMRLAMIKAMKYWILAANIDGYRCDDADGPPADFWTQAIDTLNKDFSSRKLVLFAEGQTSAEITAGFQMNNGFGFYSGLKSAFASGGTPTALFNANSAELATIPAGSFKVRYATNHDDTSSDGSAVAIYNGTAGATAAFVLSTYMSGVPELYNGNEVGFATQINFFVNTPINWSINPGMTAAFKKIIAFRAAHDAIKIGTLNPYIDASNNIVTFEKTSGTDDVLIMVNIKNTAVSFSVPANFQNTTWKDGINGGTVTLGSTATFQPYSYMVLSK